MTSAIKSVIIAAIILTASSFVVVPSVQGKTILTGAIFGGTIAVSGNNVYTAWWNNKTGDFEVMFRTSTDNGQTFGPKISISNSPGVDSTNAQIGVEGNNVYVIWWETGANHVGEPFLRISHDNGRTFGEKIMLSNATSATPLTSGSSK